MARAVTSCGRRANARAAERKRVTTCVSFFRACGAVIKTWTSEPIWFNECTCLFRNGKSEDDRIVTSIGHTKLPQNHVTDAYAR